MSSDAVYFFQNFPSLIWSLFTSFRIPGVNFTPAVFLFGLLSFRVLLWAISNVFGLGESYAISAAKSDRGRSMRSNRGSKNR